MAGRVFRLNSADGQNLNNISVQSGGGCSAQFNGCNQIQAPSLGISNTPAPTQSFDM